MSRASARQTLRCRDNIRYLFHNSIQRTEAQMDCWLYNSVTPFVIFCLFFLLFETTINPSPSPFLFSVTPNFSGSTLSLEWGTVLFFSSFPYIMFMTALSLAISSDLFQIFKKTGITTYLSLNPLRWRWRCIVLALEITAYFLHCTKFDNNKIRS